MRVIGLVAEQPGDGRPDLQSLSEIKHKDPGLANVVFNDGYNSIDLVVSLELLSQVLSQPCFSLNASHADTVVRINQTLRNLHTVNINRFHSLDGDFVVQHTSKLAEFVTASERFRLSKLDFPAPN